MKLSEYLQPETEKIPTSMKLSEYLSVQEENKTWIDEAVNFLTPKAKAVASGAVEELSFGIIEAGEEQKEEFIPYAVGRVAGGVASLMSVGAVLKAAGLGVKAVQMGLAATGLSKLGPRFIPRAIMTGATFGTHTVINQTVEQVKSGGEDIVGAGVKVVKDAGLGAALGVVGGVANRGASAVAATGLGYTSSKLEGNDEPTNIITGVMWGLFEAIGSRGRDRKLREEAVRNIKDNLTKYAVNKGMQEGAAKQAAESFINTQAAKVGGLDKVLSSQENTLTYLEVLNRNIFLSNAKNAIKPDVKAITFDQVVMKATDVATKGQPPTTPATTTPPVTAQAVSPNAVVQGEAVPVVEATPTVQTPTKPKTQPQDFATAEEYVASKKKLYHGTKEDFDTFDIERSGEIQPSDWGQGAYFTDNPEHAKNFAKVAGGDVVLERYAPDVKFADGDKLLKDSDFMLALDDEMGFTSPAEYLAEKGFGGIKFKNPQGFTEYVVFDPKQIKTKSQLISEWQAAQAKKTEVVQDVGDVVKTEVVKKDVIEPEIADPYERVVSIERKKRPSSAIKDIKEFADKAFVPISTRLSVIDESLRDAVRKHAFSVNMSTKKDIDAVVPFLENFKKMTPEDSLKLDFALKNGDVEFIDSMVSKYGVEKEFASVRKTLDGIYERAKEAGMDVGYIPEYFPRRISDTEGYLKFLRGTEDWGSIRKALQQAEGDVGRPLLEEEKAEVINSMIRGYGKEKISLKRPSNIKERKIIQLTPEMNAFYKDSGVSLTEYIKSMNDNIEARKFFGKEKNLENSVGNYVARLVDDKIISPEDEESVRQILKSYFDKRGTHGIVTGFKNLSYIATMGSPISAITQIGDLAFSLYKNGFFGTVKAVVGKKEVTKQDIGLDLIIEEFSDQSKTGELVTKVFKMVGLEGMDAFGKEVLINASFDRLSNLASKNDSKLLSELQRVFGNKAQEVFEDLKNKVPTDDVKYMLFAELANFQPIALTEMPEYYVRGGNNRIFYMLKSYTLKQFDAFNNEVFREKDPKEKMLKLVRLAAALIIMNATADTVKDIVLGRKTKFEDIVVDNILRVVGFSKWQIYKAKQDGIFETLLQSILPPIPFVDDMYKDAMKLTNKNKKSSVSDMRIWQRIPVVGKFYYWWFGGGEDIKNKGKKKNSIRD